MHSYDVVFYAVTHNATCLQLAAPELKNNGGRESARAHPPTAARPLPACVIACGRPYGHMAVNHTRRCQHGGRQPHKPGRELWHALQAAFIGSACADAALGPAPPRSSIQHLEASIAASFAGGVYRLCLQWSVPPAPVASSTDRLHQRQPTAPRRHILFTFDQVSPQLGAAIAESPVALAWPIAAR